MQVGDVLKDLNGGVDVTAEEVEWVIAQEDGKGDGTLDGVVDHNELKVRRAPACDFGPRSETQRHRYRRCHRPFEVGCCDSPSAFVPPHIAAAARDRLRWRCGTPCSARSNARGVSSLAAAAAVPPGALGGGGRVL